MFRILSKKVKARQKLETLKTVEARKTPKKSKARMGRKTMMARKAGEKMKARKARKNEGT